MKNTGRVLGTAFCFVILGCGNEVITGPQSSGDGITLHMSTPQRVAGVYSDGEAITLQFDSARVGDDLYFDLKGIDGRPIVHIDTTPTSYEFSYLGGKLTLHVTKEAIAQARAGAPENVSTDSFVFTGDRAVLDEMINLPEVRALPTLSRALGVRGLTGNTYPASLALHKIARQADDGLGIQVEPLNVSNQSSYCSAYPNSWDNCFGMCGPGCSCWSWVCGDCCYHYGCAVHDNWCREGKWYYCYNITVVIAIFGC
jgi:hypothetical protein